MKTNWDQLNTNAAEFTQSMAASYGEEPDDATEAKQVADGLALVAGIGIGIGRELARIAEATEEFAGQGRES